MAINPNRRPAPPLVTPAKARPAVPAASEVTATDGRVRFDDENGFVESFSSPVETARRVARDSQGRRRGTDDDSVGVGANSGRRGTDDDSVGLGDDAGRRGTDDDSVGFGDVVLDALVGPDADPDRLALRDALYARLETPTYLREDAPLEHVAAADLRRVSAQLQLILPGRQGSLLVAQARQTELVGARLDATLVATARLPADLRTSLIQTFATDPSGTAGAVVSHVVRSPAFAQRPLAEQQKLATIMSRLDERGLKSFGALIEQNVGALDNRDSTGRTLLDNVHELATQPLNANLIGHTTTEAVLSNALVETVNPNRVEQGTAPTCTVASMQYELIADEPSEYVRLLAGLTGPTGHAKMRGGGTLKVEAEDATAEARDGRTVSQAIFQSALMEYANGRDARFDPVIGQSTHRRTGAVRIGLGPNQQTTILRQLFGVRYTNDSLADEAEGARALESLRHFDTVGARNRPILLEIDQGAYNHAVSLERVAQGRVFFRDPYGVLRSMPEELFSKYVVAVHRPVDTRRFPDP